MRQIFTQTNSPHEQRLWQGKKRAFNRQKPPADPRLMVLLLHSHSTCFSVQICILEEDTFPFNKDLFKLLEINGFN